MSSFRLVDLYFPASRAPAAEVAAAAAAAGIDAVLYVVDAPEDLPSRETLAAARASGGAALHPAVALVGPGFRVAVLLPDWEDGGFAALEAIGDLATIQRAVSDSGGAAVPVSLHEVHPGEVERHPARLADDPTTGVVAMVARCSPLAQDLDIEHAGALGRRVLAGTGPQGTLEDIGRMSTLLPMAPDDVGDLVRCLNSGFGVALEWVRPQPRADIAGDADADGDRPKRKRRRRRRGKRSRGGEGLGEAEAPAGTAGDPVDG